MRIAVVSDVHGNLTALEAVVADLQRHSPDRVLHGGDLALSGARPAEAVDLVRELGWDGVVGNTDELLWRPEELDRQLARAPKLEPLLRIVFGEHAPATRERLGQERIAWLRDLPAEARTDDLALVHASPGDLWRAPMPNADDRELRDTFDRLGARVAVYCHIHLPYVRELDGLTVANSGSVGMPHDGDPRAAYLLVEDDRAEIRRVEYDVEAEVEALHRSGYPTRDWLEQRIRSGSFVAPP